MLTKHCLQEFILDCQLRRLSPRTVKGYPTMYLDGYTPYEIMGAASRQIYDSSQKRGDKKLEKELQVALDAAMKDLFKDWK